jgi:hypothetical protein
MLLTSDVQSSQYAVRGGRGLPMTEAGRSTKTITEFYCKVVNGKDADCALDIRRRVYIEEFGFDLGGSGPRDPIDDRSYQLLASTADGEPVGSLRLTDTRPFEIEAFLDIGPYLEQGRRPAEITRLCILAPYRRISRATFVHLAILKEVLRLAWQVGVTDFIASTREELKPFYDYLLFETYPGAVYYHPEIGNTKHTLMRLDLATVVERYRRVRPALYEAVRAAAAGVSTFE